MCFSFDSHLPDDLARIFISELDSIKMLPFPKLPDSFEQLSKTAPKLSKLLYSYPQLQENYTWVETSRLWN